MGCIRAAYYAMRGRHAGPIIIADTRQPGRTADWHLKAACRRHIFRSGAISYAPSTPPVGATGGIAMKTLHSLMLALPLLAASSLALADRDHGRGHDRGHDRHGWQERRGHGHHDDRRHVVVRHHDHYRPGNAAIATAARSTWCTTTATTACVRRRAATAGCAAATTTTCWSRSPPASSSTSPCAEPAP